MNNNDVQFSFGIGAFPVHISIMGKILLKSNVISFQQKKFKYHTIDKKYQGLIDFNQWLIDKSINH